jgi:hypothetical protein
MGTVPLWQIQQEQGQEEEGFEVSTVHESLIVLPSANGPAAFSSR